MSDETNSLVGMWAVAVWRSEDVTDPGAFALVAFERRAAPGAYVVRWHEDDEFLPERDLTVEWLEDMWPTRSGRDAGPDLHGPSQWRLCATRVEATLELEWLRREGKQAVERSMARELRRAAVSHDRLKEVS